MRTGLTTTFTARRPAVSVACAIGWLAASMAGPSAPAEAAEPEISLTIRVTDAQTDAPLSTAVIQHPREPDRHHVNTDSGEWATGVLYMRDGSELPFVKGMVVALEISAPGYAPKRVDHTLRRKRNTLAIALDKLPVVPHNEPLQQVGIVSADPQGPPDPNGP